MVKPIRLFILGVFFSVQSFAAIQVMFHPQDPTLEKIADFFASAQSHIEVAMYNLETTTKSPLILALSQEPLKSKIASGKLKIRLVFQGYGTEQDNNKKMQDLEDLGIDVRFLGASKMIHHKFAVIDAGSENVKLITGSANWSLSSRQFYSENILFIDHEPATSNQYSQEFEMLWANSHEFGKTLPGPEFVNSIAALNPNLMAVFNSNNFIFSPSAVVNKHNPASAVITDFLKSKIEKAQKSLSIASTRVHLLPLIDAIKAAVDRGVKVQIIVSQDEFNMGLRGPLFDLIKQKPNIDLRIKFYDLRPYNYLLKQMHNKYMIVDDRDVLTGSFNWSPSSENSYIENEIFINGDKYPDALASYKNNFAYLWQMNREQYPVLLKRLVDKQSVACALDAMVLSVNEIYSLLKANKQNPCLASDATAPAAPGTGENHDGGDQ